MKRNFKLYYHPIGSKTKHPVYVDLIRVKSGALYLRYVSGITTNRIDSIDKLMFCKTVHKSTAKRAWWK